MMVNMADYDRTKIEMALRERELAKRRLYRVERDLPPAA
jgi:hypothetical protein